MLDPSNKTKINFSSGSNSGYYTVNELAGLDVNTQRVHHTMRPKIDYYMVLGHNFRTALGGCRIIFGGQNTFENADISINKPANFSDDINSPFAEDYEYNGWTYEKFSDSYIQNGEVCLLYTSDAADE